MINNPAAPIHLYEQPMVQQVLGETLRPGGLALTKRALFFCQLSPSARVVDVGCGAGKTVEYLNAAGYLACGLDLSAFLLNQGRLQNPASPFIQAPANRLPLRPGHLDALLMECSLSEFAETGAVLAECRRVLKSYGYLIISDIYARNPAGLAALKTVLPNSCLCRAFVQKDLLDAIDQNGFNIQLLEDHSDSLKQLAPHLISQFAELGQLEPAASAGEMDALDVQLAVARAKPGYFLLVAQKR